MPHFTSPLEGMEIAIPPSSGNIEQETDEYGRTRKKYARRPLPPAPHKVPPISIARTPVGSPPGSKTRSDVTLLPSNTSQMRASSKPLPPEPLRKQRPPSRRGRIVLPTGHSSSQKISRVMGPEVDIHAGRRDITSVPFFCQTPCSSSVCSHDEFPELLGQSPMKSAGPPTLPCTPCPGCDPNTQHVSFEQQAQTSGAQHLFHRCGDAWGAPEYHRFASRLLPDSIVSVDNEIYHNHFSGISERTPLSSHRRSPSLRLDVVDQDAFETSRQHSSESPSHVQHHCSAFDSDSDDDETANIVNSIMGFFSPRRDADLPAKTKRQSHKEGIISDLDRPNSNPLRDQKIK